MLLMGMNMSFTKNPMKPMTRKPTPVAVAIFLNSKTTQTKIRTANRSCQGSWHAS